MFPNGDAVTTFNGINDYLEASDDSAFSISTTGELTWEAWINPSTIEFPHDERSGYVHFIGKGTYGNYEWAGRIYSYTNTESPPRPNRISGYVWNPIGNQGAGAYFQETVTPGEWIHVAVSYNVAADSIKIYKNGVLKSTSTLSSYSVVPVDGVSPLRVGTRDKSSYFKGDIAKVAIYNREVSASDLADHYTASTLSTYDATVIADTPVAYWPLGADLEDHIGSKDLFSPTPAPYSSVFVSNLNVVATPAGPTAPITIPRVYNYIAPDWTIAVGSNRIGKEYDITNSKSRSLTVRLNDEATSSFSLPGESVYAKLITEMEDDVWWIRNGETLHRGRIIKSNDGDGATYDASFTSASYEALLERRALHTQPYHEYASFPSFKINDIIKWLIDHAENQKFMRLGLSYGEWLDLPTFESMYGSTATEEDVVQVQDGDGILTAIRTICTILDPDLDFWIDPFLKCNLAQPRGKDQGVVLDYEGVIADFSRSFDSDNYANVIREKGAKVLPEYYSSGGQGTPTTDTHTGTSSSALNTVLPPGPYSPHPIGGWQDDRTNDHLYNVSAIKGTAKSEYRRSSKKSYTWNVLFAPGQWRGPSHVWVGDFVWFIANRGRINVRENMRVQSISISLDDNGVETVTAELDRTSDYKQSLRKVRKSFREMQKKKKAT